jgi:proton-translocating NADH-quinone oxidoreductase chain M
MILFLIFFILFFCLIFLFFIPNSKITLIRNVALLTTGVVLVLSCFLLNFFHLNYYYFQDLITFKVGFELLNLYLVFGLDGLSIYFFSLSCLLIFLCILFIWNEQYIKEYTVLLILLELLLLLVFSTLDILFFYIFFEAILVPMYIMIGFFGSRERKIRAVYLFFFYTLIGSLCMLLALLYIYSKLGTLNFEYVYFANFSFIEQCWLWLAFFLSFSSKIPLFPFHIWLPEAHVEAPTVGSVLLAGILLKLGVFGFLRFNLNLFPDASIFFAPIVYVFSILGIIYASMSALRQTDMKRIIAYSSVAHMNLITMGIFSFNILGIEGSILQSISHGFVSSALFLLIGILYKRYHSRFLFYFSGLTHTMPLFSFFFCFFTMANIALPGTSSFVGEFLLLLGIFKVSPIASIIACTGVILCGSYSLWLYNRICFGNLKTNNVFLFKDINLNEFVILGVLGFFVLFMGVYPKFFSQYLHIACTNYIIISSL